MSSTVSSLYNLAMQNLTTKTYITNEKPKELSASRLKRDEIDLREFAEKLNSVTPFSTMNHYEISSQYDI